MKRLSDYKDDAALELWADILDPLTGIFSDDEMLKVFTNGTPIMKVAAEILRKHKTEAKAIVLAIDPTEITALNLLPRVLQVVNDIKTSEEIKGFFGSSPAETREGASSGSVMANTGADGQ